MCIIRAMNDTSQPDQSGQRPRPPSQGGRPRQGGGKPRGHRPLSKESRFVGYLVLGFGLLAVIAVLVLAFSGRGGDPQTAEQTSAPAPTLTPALAPGDLVNNDLSALESRRTRSAATSRDLLFERTPKFNASAMEGDWQAMIGRYTAVLQIRKDVFQIILASTDPAAPRYYSSGTFKVTEDIIMLEPRQDWPPPASTSGRVSYAKLTRAPFAVIARYSDDLMLWQNPPSSEKRVNGPHTNPIFMAENVRLASWKKIQ